MENDRSRFVRFLKTHGEKIIKVKYKNIQSTVRNETKFILYRSEFCI